MTDELMALADRVEALTGPCRETDLAIHMAAARDERIAVLMATHWQGFGNQRLGTAWELRAGGILYETYNDRGECVGNGSYPLPAYTASLDAAMTLVPKGWTRYVRWSPDNESRAAVYDGRIDTWDVFETTGKTEALALTAAALRARAAKEPKA